MKIFENLDINDLDGEIWKDVLDYEGDYQASNIGRVKSFKHNKMSGKILKQSKQGDYFIVGLCKNEIPKTKLVHRLVHEAHIGKLEKGYDAHHINEDKEDNYVENLESKPHSEHISFHNPKGETHRNFGKHPSEKTKKKLSENHVGMKGKHHSEESKNKMSEKSKGNKKMFGKHHSDETRKKMSDSRGGKHNPNFGKGISSEKIIDIQSDIKKGDLSQKHIAKKHNISQSTVSLIKREKHRSNKL